MSTRVELHSLSRRTTSTVLLIGLWLVSILGMGVSLLPHLKDAVIVTGLSSFGFILVLIWYLSRTTPHTTDLPDLTSRLLPQLGFWQMLGVITAVILALLVVGMAVGSAFSLLLVSALIALGVSAVWRQRLTWHVVGAGLAAGVGVALGIQFLGNGDTTWAIFNAVTTPLVLIAGALFVQHTHLAQVRMLNAEYAHGLRSFLWGCTLALPAGLLNSLGGMQAADTWLTHWWQPFYALIPAIGEESWARLFLTTLCYALLRPTVNDNPRRALVAAIVIGALVHSFAHTGVDPIGLLVGGLLYGVPTGLLYVKRDLEHAVGYHFLIDFVRYLAALLQA